jgi:hypothetical protein
MLRLFHIQSAGEPITLIGMSMIRCHDGTTRVIVTKKGMPAIKEDASVWSTKLNALSRVIQKKRMQIPGIVKGASDPITGSERRKRITNARTWYWERLIGTSEALCFSL